tara:strand:- start:193 stop:420 length:228 start_codon:yes stop_codon:yes gene_type:complete
MLDSVVSVTWARGVCAGGSLFAAADFLLAAGRFLTVFFLVAFFVVTVCFLAVVCCLDADIPVVMVTVDCAPLTVR